MGDFMPLPGLRNLRYLRTAQPLGITRAGNCSFQSEEKSALKNFSRIRYSVGNAIYLSILLRNTNNPDERQVFMVQQTNKPPHGVLEYSVFVNVAEVT
jgi:hypothetical protein